MIDFKTTDTTSDAQRNSSDAAPSFVDAPPAYASAPTSSAGRVNFFHLVEKHHPVEGSFTVDPNLQIPASFLPASTDPANMDNIRLYSHHRSVTATLSLISDQPCRSRINVGSKHRDVTVTIVARRNQRFFLTATTKHRNVTVYLPRDFEGPITFTTGKGSPIFSEGVKPLVSIFGAKEGNGKAFIGRWDGIEDEKGLAAWSGDEAILTTKYGTVKVAFADEVEKQS